MAKKAAQLITVMFGLSGVIMPEEKKKNPINTRVS